MPKIKIDQTELSHFSYESLIVDPYWSDLYNGVDKDKNSTKK